MRSSEELKRLLNEEGEATEQDRGGDYAPAPGSKVSRGHGRTKTLQVRLNDDEHAALEALASARNLPLSTLVRSMLLPALTSADADPARVEMVIIIERMRSELDLLSRRIAS